MREWAPQLLQTCALALVYYATARLGLLLQFEGLRAVAGLQYLAAQLLQDSGDGLAGEGGVVDDQHPFGCR